MKIIPIFIPHAGCPYRCIYCDQHKISGAIKIPSVEEIHSIIERNLKTIPKGERVEIAFFGGTFTLLLVTLQKKYLSAVYPYVKSKKIAGIRMSTHPEAVTDSSMKLFKENGGCLVELGVQSLDKDVLKKAKRVMDFNTIKNAARIIKKSGLDLGVQVMLGLPEDTLQKSINTAAKLIELKPKTARIYPAVVLKGTGLGDLFKRGGYKPLSMEDAVEWSARVTDIFEKAGVKVIRIGLHPSEELNSKAAVLAGPYHVSFGEMARSRQMRHRIVDILGPEKIRNRRLIEIHAPENLFNFISGHKGQEKKFLEKYYGVSIIFRASRGGLNLPYWPLRIQIKDLRKTIAIIDPRMPLQAKDKLKKMNFYLAEAPLHKKLANPVKGHPDMMLFSHGKKVIYEPSIEAVAELLRNNRYQCIKGADIKSKAYPKDVIYNACAIGDKIIRYKGAIEKNIENLKCKFIKVNQGYVKCSIIPVDDKHIITSDKGISDKWAAANRGRSLLITPGHIKLPGYKSGFIGGASGVYKNNVFFVGSLKYHPDGDLIRDFIKCSGKNVIELYSGPLYDAGSILFFEAST
jgi:radical SAM superfamily enzyme